MLALTKLHEHFTHHSTTFLSFLPYTNSSIWKRHRLHIKNLCLFFFSMTCIVYSRYASQQAHHHKAKFLGSQHVSSPFYVSSSMALLHISWVLRQSGKYIKYHGSSSMTWLHIFCISYWSGTKHNVYPFTSTAFSYIFLGLTFIGNKFHNTVSLSVAWINNSHSSRDNSETVVSKKFIHFLFILCEIEQVVIHRKVNQQTVSNQWWCLKLSSNCNSIIDTKFWQKAFSRASLSNHFHICKHVKNNMTYRGNINARNNTSVIIFNRQLWRGIVRNKNPPRL